MDGSLYASTGDWMDNQLSNAATVPAQVMSLSSPTGTWVSDGGPVSTTGSFLNVVTKTKPSGVPLFLSADNLGTAYFDHDMNNVALTNPVDLLFVGFWNLNVSGLSVAEKTIVHSTGVSGTWKVDTLVPTGNPSGQVRSFAGYTDTVTGEEMAFTGGDNSMPGTGSYNYGIFLEEFNSTTNRVQWNTTAPETGSNPVCWALSSGTDCRTMSFAACGPNGPTGAGRALYATLYDTVYVRTDGTTPSWTRYYQYPGDGTYNPTGGMSGFRGLTCVAKSIGAGYQLITALEGGGIYAIPVQGDTSFQPGVELNTNSFISSYIGAYVTYTITAYNDMPAFPNTGPATGHKPDLVMGVGLVNVPTGTPGSWTDPAGQGGNNMANPYLLVRHSNGAYDIQTVAGPSWGGTTPPLSARTVAPSLFAGDTAGAIYIGGYDGHGVRNHNTDWLYRGTP